MAETGEQQLLILVGELKGDMEEGQRQRSRQFKILEDISKKLAGLLGRFDERCENDDRRWEEFKRRMEAQEKTIADLTSRIAVVEQPAEGSPRRRTLSLSLLTVIGGSGGLAGLFFGNGLAKLVGQGLDLLKKIPH